VRLSFRDAYVGRDVLLNLNKSLKENVFNSQLIRDRAINTNNGWYVVGDAFSNALSESKGLLVFSPNELNELKTMLNQRKLWLDQQGIKFYISIAPNKLTTYDTLIPISKNNRLKKMQQLDSLCQQLGIPFINLGQDFDKYPNLRLFHKTDTHWNDQGAFVAYNTVINRFKKDFPNKKFKDFKIEELQKTITRTLQGDLTKMLKIDTKEEFIHLKLDTTFAKHLKEKKHQIPENYWKKEVEHYELRYTNDKQTKKILVFRDSFWGYCNPFFIENFNETLLIWDYVFDKELVKKEKPDIILYELVERNIDYLLDSEKY